MSPKVRHLALLVLLCALLGWWLGRGMRPDAPERTAGTVEAPAHSPRYRPLVPKKPVMPLGEESPSADQFPDGTTIEIFASSHPDQIILRFPSDETYGSFLGALASSKVRLAGKEDRLRALRVAFDNFADLDALLDDENVTHYTSLPDFPSPPAHNPVQRGLLGFGDQAPAWLGVTGDNSRWGSGVRIAIIDGGVVEHPGLPRIAEFVDVTPESGNPSEPVDHGTAVASIISGTNPRGPGVAPAATLISIRVVDGSLRSDSLSFASGLLAAADHRAQLVNVSMGTSEDNPMIREAVEIVQRSGAVIIAAAGNSGLEQAAYPAAYPGVISVGAVDARGTQVEFSNYADMLSITAPGYAVNAAAPGGNYVRMSGTSASAPFVTGAIAATMSTSPMVLPPRQAAEIVMDHADEAGIPGPDSQYGSGILNLRRIMNRNQPGITDVAVTHQSFSADSSKLGVTLQNRGTKPLVNLLLETVSAGGSNRMNIDSLAPNEVRTFSLAIAPGRQSPFQVTTTVDTGVNGADVKPADNTGVAKFSLK
ncbi:S8 family serine peptidase [Luteolibacter sp. SL250]|uniref:S8 family peptidase n=1 Tax=Luteolibacter sp. SL250 TaxID=2995170 RepID=UPI00226DEB9E|nr:S8 family serine peptidase [Luteolibacter sp. SL250]WAC18416.1 S8 family serine peptidase [Luteolibacter sp. SL250]